MYNKILATGFFLLSFCLSQAQQRYFTKTGKVVFVSEAPLETIEAVNKTAGAVLDASTGAVQFLVLMRGFEFKKALMQEHFNENYVESHKYPKAEFRGSIVNNNTISYTKDGSYPVTVKGQLTIHGITKPLQAPATLLVQGGVISAKTIFTLLVSDYQISIPSIVKDKVSNQVSVSVEAKLDPLKP